ncbi:MAG: hypothetical protein M3O50_17885 [Myxococcota bacterium]|nr:hypothetical protein [Myxococcota bacterium]
MTRRPRAAVLDSPGDVASGDANETSSIATAPDETPDTESAKAGEGELTCAAAPVYVHTRPSGPGAHESPPNKLIALVMWTCSR